VSLCGASGLPGRRSCLVWQLLAALDMSHSALETILAAEARFLRIVRETIVAEVKLLIELGGRSDKGSH
jgi:hypothetical protein